MKAMLLGFCAVFSISVLVISCSRGSNDPEAAVAHFTYTSTRTLPATVHVTNTSTSPGGPSVYKWEYGDGTPAVYGDAPPPHAYNAFGVYQLKLVQIPAGAPNDTVVQLINISPMGPSGSSNRTWNSYTASFRSAVNYASYNVTFTNTSTGTGNSYMWDFGDGMQENNNSVTVNHAYTMPGTYHVVLTATNAASVDTCGATIVLQ